MLIESVFCPLKSSEEQLRPTSSRSSCILVTNSFHEPISPVCLSSAQQKVSLNRGSDLERPRRPIGPSGPNLVSFALRPFAEGCCWLQMRGFGLSTRSVAGRPRAPRATKAVHSSWQLVGPTNTTYLV